MGLSAQNTIIMKREVRRIHLYTTEKEKTNDTKVINNTISLGFQRQSHKSLEYYCFKQWTIRYLRGGLGNNQKKIRAQKQSRKKISCTTNLLKKKIEQGLGVIFKIVVQLF